MIGGLTVGALGGAYSVDQEYRTAGKDWWPNEEPTTSEARKLMNGGPVDVLITHDVPAGVTVEPMFVLPAEIRTKADCTRESYSAKSLIS